MTFQYQHWQIWMGRNDRGAKTVIRPLIGGLQVQQVRVPVLHPFTTFRFAIRTQRTDATFVAAWICTLYKNNASAAVIPAVPFATSSTITETNGLWTDGFGTITPISFDRGDNWYIELTGAPVDDPRVICGIDCFGRAQASFGGGTN